LGIALLELKSRKNNFYTYLVVMVELEG